MSNPILLTKLFAPAMRSEYVSRPRLIEKLNQSINSRLTLISAPAGFGKTTLVTDWLQTKGGDASSPFHVAWLSLDEGENNPVQFLIYLIAALVQGGALTEKFGDGLQSMLHSPQSPPLDSILFSLINEISASQCQMFIIFDDYHWIQDQPVNDILTFFIENLPSMAHLIITTREDPNFPLARLRARNQLSEIRASDLLFSSIEAGEFLNQVMGLSLSEAEIELLELRTEGWIAGLQLAAISMQGQDDKPRFIETFSGSDRLVLDYLIEEVINQQSEAVQDFLLKTAILNRLSGSLCNAVTGQSDGQAVLEKLDRANLFIIPLDNERRWFRYHHLFAELLKQQLRRSQSKEIPALHRRASEWYEKNGFVNQAIDNAFIADDIDRAIILIEEQIDDLWAVGENVKVKNWLQKIPNASLITKPKLYLFYAWYSFLSNQPDEGERALQMVEKSIDPDDSDHKILSGRVAVIRAMLMTYSGDMQKLIEYSRQGLDFLPETDLYWRNLTFIAMGDAYSHLGDMQAAHDIRAEAVRVWKATGEAYWILVAYLKLATTYRYQGRLQAAIEIYQQQMQVANEYGLSQIRGISWLLGSWAEVMAEINDLEMASDLSEQALEVIKHGWDEAMIALGCMCLMRILLSKEDIQGAIDLVQKMEEIAIKSLTPPWWANKLIAAWKVRVWLLQDNLELAANWAKERETKKERDRLFVGEIEDIVLARVYIAQGRLDEAVNLLQRLFEDAQAGGRVSKVVETLILQALAYQSDDKTEKAVTAIEKALSWAEPGGYVRTFVDEGPPMAKLLYEALSQGIAAEYVQKLLAAFPEIESGNETIKQTIVSDSEWIEPLSDREIDVLQLIARGLSRQEIAEELVISGNTVKTHVRNIYGKLGVNNQMQAVGKARGLGLLDKD